jgi:hypothetical protein
MIVGKEPTLSIVSTDTDVEFFDAARVTAAFSLQMMMNP